GHANSYFIQNPQNSSYGDQTYAKSYDEMERNLGVTATTAAAVAVVVAEDVDRHLHTKRVPDSSSSSEAVSAAVLFAVAVTADLFLGPERYDLLLLLKSWDRGSKPASHSPEKPIQDEKVEINAPVAAEKEGGEPTTQDQQSPAVEKETGGGVCEACISCFQLISVVQNSYYPVPSEDCNKGHNFSILASLFFDI
ncbi:9010_t:CDS:2, partial [Acaulospora colombiana]